MTTASLLEELRHYQALLLDTVAGGEARYNHQYHPDLSPLGWHLGHCVYTEIYWLRERLLHENDDNEALKALYVPEFMPKDRRAAALPPADELCAWARRVQDENRERLGELLESGCGDPLLEENYLLHFLNQHYAQHYETTRYILAQHRQQSRDREVMPPRHGDRRTAAVDGVAVPAGEYRIGSDRLHHPYDNESPAFRVQLPAFHIALRPVSNGEFRHFMEDGGYHRQEFWSRQGWHWRQAHGAESPQHWHRDERGDYLGIDADGARILADGEPVSGVCHHEAAAFAAWAGARLPHEYEWEAAMQLGLLEDCGRVWEWCANPFHPYDGFCAFPYEGYSVPYFDNRHFTLRGGSDYTRPCIRRDSFRNYYEADKRHIHAGLRLAWS